MRFTTQRRAAFLAKFFKAVVVRGKWSGERREGGGGGGGGWRLEITGGGATSQEIAVILALFSWLNH